MNYEKIIVELLSRIQVLEEQVAALTENRNPEESGEKKVTTSDVRDYIENQKKAAKESGATSVVLRSGDVHKELGLKNRIPLVCNAMRQCMGDQDVVLHTTPSGNSSTIEIEYKL